LPAVRVTITVSILIPVPFPIEITIAVTLPFAVKPLTIFGRIAVSKQPPIRFIDTQGGHIVASIVMKAAALSISALVSVAILVAVPSVVFPVVSTVTSLLFPITITLTIVVAICHVQLLSFIVLSVCGTTDERPGLPTKTVTTLQRERDRTPPRS
jgi:hypothetical protein